MKCWLATRTYDPEMLENGMDMDYQAQFLVNPVEHHLAPAGPSHQVLDSSVPAQQFQQSNSTSDPPTAEDSSQNPDFDSDQHIGAVLKNGGCKCNKSPRASKSFKRVAELKRHYNTTHADQKPEFWCKIIFCNRSAAAGGKSFHRRYRLQAHMRTIHPGISVDGDVGMTQGKRDAV
jgi:hypothetical protein